MSIQRFNLHADTSPVFFDFMTIPQSISTWLQKERFDKLFDSMKDDLQKYTSLVRDSKSLFFQADINLHRTTILCAVAALFAMIAGIGMAVCPAEYTKTRRAFVVLTLTSCVLSALSAFILYHMHSKVSDYKSLFEG